MRDKTRKREKKNLLNQYRLAYLSIDIRDFSYRFMYIVKPQEKGLKRLQVFRYNERAATIGFELYTKEGAKTILQNFFNIKQLANHFGVTKATIHNWRRKGVLPSGIKLGGVRLWAIKDIQAIEERQLRS